MLQEVVKQEPQELSLDGLSQVVTSGKAPVRATAVQKRQLLQFFDGGHYRNLEEVQEVSQRVGLSVTWIQSWMTRTRVSRGLARSRKANGKQDEPKEVIKIEDDDPIGSTLFQESISQGRPAKRRRKRVVSSYHVPADIIDVDESSSSPSVKTAPPQIRLTIRLPARPPALAKPSAAQPNVSSSPQSVPKPIPAPGSLTISSVALSGLPLPPPPLTVVPPPARQAPPEGAGLQTGGSDDIPASIRPSPRGPVISSTHMMRSPPTIRIPATANLSGLNVARKSESTSALASAHRRDTPTPLAGSSAVARSSSSTSSSETRQNASSQDSEYIRSRCRVYKRHHVADPPVSSRRAHPGLLSDTDYLTVYTRTITPANKRIAQPKKSKDSVAMPKSSKGRMVEQESKNGRDTPSGSASKDVPATHSDSSSDGSSSDSDDASILDGISNKSTVPPESSHTNAVPANSPPYPALPPPIRPLADAQANPMDLSGGPQLPPTPPPSKTSRPRASLNVTFSETPTIVPNTPEMKSVAARPSLSQPTFANVPAKRIYPLKAVPVLDELRSSTTPPPHPSAKPKPPHREEAVAPVYQGVHTFMFDPDLPAKTQEELNASIRVTKKQPESDFARLLRAKIDPYDMNKPSFRRVSLPSSISSRGLP